MWPDATIQDWLTGLRRRWWIIVGLPLMTAAFTIARPPAAAQVVEARLTVAVDVQPDAGAAGRLEGSEAEVGEALIDDLSRVLPGDAFAAAVRARLPGGVTVSPGDIQSSVSAEDRHRVTDVTVRRTVRPDARGGIRGTYGDADVIAAAVVAELTEHGSRWASHVGADGTAFTIVDGPRLSTAPGSVADRVALPLRLMLALLVAVGLAAVLHAVDPALYSPHDATTAAAAPVLGTVARRKRPVRSTRDRGSR